MLQFPLHGIADHLAAWAHYDADSSLAFGAFAIVTVAMAFLVTRWFEAPMRQALRRAWGLRPSDAPGGSHAAAAS